ncbi:MAG: hypothetical protein IPI28_18925 [Candidatus Omnitrophica bacterium]|nr:hypothetical protein [Candidatus Omnitrophota bacterium]
MEKLELKIKGLYLSPNDYSSVPVGALLEAKNGVLDKESVFDSRRGQNFYSTAALGSAPDSLFGFNTSLLAHYGTKLAYDDGAGVITDYTGTFSQPASGYKIHSIEANKNFYFTTSTGIKKLDAVAGTPTDAGAPPGLDISGALNGASGFLDDASIVAYRMLWGYKDANGNLIVGAPSQRFIVSNSTGGTRNVSLTFTIPSGITTAWFYQIYRSVQFTPVTISPNDELYIAYEGNPAAGDITAKLLTVIDATPDALLGETLYTSPTQQGIENANTPPPFAKDLTLYNNMTLYANTQNKNRLLVTYLGGLTVGATVTIAGTVYTGQAAENIAAKEFQIFSAGTPAENIEDTSLSLIRVINRYASNTAVYAYYLSGFNDLPGRIAFEERAVGGATFYALSSAGASFNPTLPASGTTIASSNDAKQNGIYISKINQPEAVPLYAYVFVGSANKAIRRILALRDSVFIFKDDGIFRLTGTDFQSIVVSLFDGSKKLVAYDSPAVFDNQIYCFVDQGIGAVSEQGVQIISKPIENQLLMVSQFANFAANTFGVGYDSDRKYYFWTVSTSTDTYPTFCWVWNSITSAWTTNDLPRSCGIVLAGTNKLYMGNPVNKFIYVERKSLTFLDYADESYAITITGVSGKVLTVASATNIAVGDAIKQGLRIALVESIDSLDITVNYELAFTAAAATVEKPFHVRCAFVPLDADNPAVVKHFPECSYFFKESFWTEILAGWSSNNANEEQYALVPPPNSTGNYGTEIYGTGVYGLGGTTGGRNVVRTYLPLEPSMANWVTSSLELNEPFTNISFMGMEYQYNPMSTKLVAQ